MTIKVLFLAANPRDTKVLRLGEEMRTIQEKLRASELGNRFKIEQEWAVRVGDAQGHLLRHKPHIVHFSGHGSAAGEIVLEDQAGNSKPVSRSALRKLFTILKDNVRCVVLNACFSRVQAEAIAESIDCVVGMSTKVHDEAAIAFAASFYQALGFGRSIQTAFDLACLEIEMHNLREQDVPKLLVTSSNVNPEAIYLAIEPAPATLQAGFTNWIDISDQIVNPGFEDGFLGWEEDSSVINSEQATSRSVDDSTEAHSGTHSRKLFLREGGSYIKQIVKLKNPLSAQCQVRLGVYVKMPFRGDPANKRFTLMLITHGGSSDQVDYWQKGQRDTLAEWTKVTTQTEQLDYPIHKLEIHAFTTKGGGAHKGFDKPVWVDDFTIEHRSPES